MAYGPRVNVGIVEKRFAVIPGPLLADFHLTVGPSTVGSFSPSGVSPRLLLLVTHLAEDAARLGRDHRDVKEFDRLSKAIANPAPEQRP